MSSVWVLEFDPSADGWRRGCFVLVGVFNTEAKAMEHVPSWVEASTLEVGYWYRLKEWELDHMEPYWWV